MDPKLHNKTKPVRSNNDYFQKKELAAKNANSNVWDYKTRPALSTVHQGRVKKITQFGAYVKLDGYDNDGLLHNSAFKNIQPLRLSQIIKVKIQNYTQNGQLRLELADDTKSVALNEEKKTTEKKECLDENTKNEKYQLCTNTEKPVWNVGDFCRACYSEDSHEYEAKIVSFGEEDPENGLWATIQFIGYNNYESVWIKDISLSHGEQSRIDQNNEVQNYELANVKAFTLNDLEQNLESKDKGIDMIKLTNVVDEKGDISVNVPPMVAEGIEKEATESVSDNYERNKESDDEKGDSESRREYIHRKIDELQQTLKDLESSAKTLAPLDTNLDDKYDNTNDKRNISATNINPEHNTSDSCNEASLITDLSNLETVPSSTVNDQMNKKIILESKDIPVCENNRKLDQMITSKKRLATIKEENNAEIEDVAVVKISSNNFQNESNAFEKFVEAHADIISTIATLPSEKSINDISAEHKQVMKSENTELLNSDHGLEHSTEGKRNSIENLLDCSPYELDKAIGFPQSSNTPKFGVNCNVSTTLENNQCSEDSLIKISEESVQEKKEKISIECREEANDAIAKSAFRFILSKIFSPSINIERLVDDMLHQWKNIG